MKTKPLIYVDNAATTAVLPEVLEAMLPLYQEQYGNPSSIHRIGRAAKTKQENARRQIAACLNAKALEIFFTGSGTESDNWAIKSAAQFIGQTGKKHIIASSFEHHAVLNSLASMEKQGFTVSYLDVEDDGLICPETLSATIRPDTGLVTTIYANNEIGTIQPIMELANICHDKGILFHTDAVQAVGHIPIDLQSENIDLLSFSGHKLYGPKGIGGLYVREGLSLPKFLDGGAQERGMRGGTENLPGIVGMATALKFACNFMGEETQRITAMRDRLIDGLLSIEGSSLNGDRKHRLPGNANISFDNIEGESLLLMLDMQGVCASSGSACTSGSLEPSHVLMAMGVSKAMAKGSLRLTLGHYNSMTDIDYILEVVPPVVEKLRSFR